AAHASDRVRAQGRRFPRGDARDRGAGLLDRAGLCRWQRLSGADADRRREGSWHPEALGAAALLRSSGASRRRRRSHRQPAQPGRRPLPRHHRRLRYPIWRRHRRARRGAPAVAYGRAEMSDGATVATPVSANTTREPVLRIAGGSKIYGGVHAIEGVDFDLYPGEVHALVGENGAGKSTLCKAIAGAIELTSGDFFLDGKLVRFAQPREALQA